ncbi:Mss4-like protein [Hypoxylon fuscum]|nr:Mss4-like protein [Hypoxylon fuscum]
MAAQQPIKKYRVNCHCAAYICEISLPEIRTGLQFNDPYNHKRGGVFLQPRSDDDIAFVKGNQTTLSSYSLGEVKHQFCLNCGTYLLRVDSKIYVNLRAFQNLNVWDLDIQTVDSASQSLVWSLPKFNGREPSAKIDGAKLHTGGCHCGAITVALKSKPLDRTYANPLIDCDCSICSRNGYIWVYPSKAQVSIVGWENMNFYIFGRGIWRKTFCKTCGVPVHNHIENYSPEQINELPEEYREWAASHLEWSPVNVRVLDGVDIGELNIRRVNGSATAKGRPDYVNP